LRVFDRTNVQLFYKGPRKGEFSGNPLGKNPSDVWEIPNVKALHVEKTAHPCQFPVALAKRLIDAVTPRQGIVLDPFAGSASAGVAAILSGRRFIGAEINKRYVNIARRRMTEALNGSVRYRPEYLPVRLPQAGEAVSKRPPHFKIHK
jgi:adenine-specific DNA-methyltransferase